MTERLTRVSAASASAVLLAMAWPSRATTLDDAWITARYALMLAHGHGPVYNPGEWIEGASSPAWTLLLAAAIRLGLDPYPVMVYAGLACGLLLPPATAWLALRLGASPTAAALAPWPVALSPHLAVACTNGLETAAWLLALVFACGAALGGGWAAGLAVGLLALVRPEGVAVALALAVARRDRGFALGTATTVLLTLSVRLAVYGALLPNPVAAKRDGTAIERILGNLEFVARDGVTWFAVVSLALVAVALPGRRRERAIPVGIGLLLLAGLVQVDEWMPGMRLQLPLWVLGTAAWAAADVPRWVPGLPVVGALLVLGAVGGRTFRYDARNSVLPDNPASHAAAWIGEHAPPESTVATRDAGVLAFHVGPDVRVVELHPRALTRLHPDGADAEPPDLLPEVLITTVQHESWPSSRYPSDLALLGRGPWVFLGRARQHHLRYYDFWARRGVAIPPLPEELRIR